MAKAVELRKRGAVWYLVRRVPVRYRKVERRKEIWVNLNTDSHSIAQQKAGQHWGLLIEGWEAAKAGDPRGAEEAFRSAQDLANRRGFRWMEAAKVADLPLQELLDRIADATKSDGTPSHQLARGVLGGAKIPDINVTRALELYWELAADSKRGKSADQIRRWKNPRIKAIANFIGVVGDLSLSSITRDHMLEFKEWWRKRLDEEELTPNSANKDIGYVESTLNLVNEQKRLKLELPLGRLRLKETDKKSRPPFSDDWIKKKILAPSVLDGLDADARDVVLVMVNTGARPSEIVGLLPHHIHLGDVPYFEIKAEGKQTKNSPSKRKIPLVGISLEAMRRHPEGFPTYRFKDKISDVVNRYFKINSLRETDEHVLYSLRHSFEDRMLAAKIDERIRRDIMGHSCGVQLGARDRVGA